ncbi:hypothetical protein N24_2539 [Corynebacterium suranareeae]|uniref:TM2 domain-containing protein n=1 Tax=Corynebacterium suranareeae TaxID=2506452 RepID=A0A160PUJ8_9CORY|nr:hypothetical protein [Corynebacterium suranareeae]BAU96801.1 hypothetical protein N24_2539 [Corynebacterium suranareeae]
MFGYVPTGPFNMTDEETEGVAIPRTKSRAYMIAVWAGPWGAHQFFLNNPVAGYLHWIPVTMLAAFPSWLGFGTGLPLAVLLNAVVWFYAIFSMATMPEDDPRLQGHTSERYADRMMWMCKISLWGIDFWKKHRIARAE